MTTGLVIPHASGARVVVNALALSDAWSGGEPTHDWLERLTADARDARDTSAHYESRVHANGAHTPRWLATATCVVDDERTIFQWLTNDAMRAPLVNLLERGIGEAPDEQAPAPGWIDRGLALQRIEVRFDALSSYLGSLSYRVDHVLPTGALDGTEVFLVDATFLEDGRVYSIGWLVPALPALVLHDVVRRAVDDVPWGLLATRTNA